MRMYLYSALTSAIAAFGGETPVPRSRPNPGLWLLGSDPQGRSRALRIRWDRIASRYCGLSEKHVVERLPVCGLCPNRPRRGVALRIGIDEQHFQLRSCQGRCEIDGGGGLSHPALLICYGDDARQECSRFSMILSCFT